MNTITRVHQGHIKINDEDFYTYEYARDQKIKVSKQIRDSVSWVVDGREYLQEHKGLDLDESSTFMPELPPIE